MKKDLDFVFCKLLQNVRRILHLSRAKKYCWFGDCKKFLAISPSFSCRCQINESYDFEKSIFSSSRTNVLVLRDLILCLLFYVVPKNRSHTLVCQFISGLHANFLALFWYQTDVKFTLKNSIWSMILQFTVTFGCLRWVFYIHRFGKNKQRMRQSLEAFCNLQISKIALNERNARVFSRFCTNFVNDAKNKNLQQYTSSKS